MIVTMGRLKAKQRGASTHSDSMKMKRKIRHHNDARVQDDDDEVRIVDKGADSIDLPIAKRNYKERRKERKEKRGAGGLVIGGKLRGYAPPTAMSFTTRITFAMTT